MTVLDKVVRWLVGVLFIFSGLVKLNDPQGFAIKLEEYFEVFSVEISSFFHFFVPYSLPIALFVVILEILLGVAVLINYKMKITVWILLILIVFFTFLTFYSAYFNKVTDCGCFGDAIPLTPWQSFGKDVILSILIIYLFIRKSNYKDLLPKPKGEIVLGIALAISVFIGYWAIEHLPPVDFRPYKVGADIATAMKPSAPYQYMYLMEKDGEVFEFDHWVSDSTYTYKDMILLNPEAEPKITDYSIWSDEGEFTEESLTGTKLLVIFHDVNKSRFSKVEKIVELAANLKTFKLDVTSGQG